MALSTVPIGNISGYSLQITPHTNTITILEKSGEKKPVDYPTISRQARVWHAITPGTDIIIDFSTIQPRLEIKKETSSLADFFKKDIHEHDVEKDLAKAMLKYDSIGLMPPKEKQTTIIEITKISKGKPLDMEPDTF